MDAMRTDMHGSIVGFKPVEAIDSVLSTTAFEYQLLDDKILIRR